MSRKSKAPKAQQEITMLPKPVTMTLEDGRQYELHDCRLVGTSLFGKLPNGVEIELTDGEPVEYQS